MKIYADILFFMNFYADYFVISLASEFAGKKVSFLKKILSGIIGGVYGVIAFFPDMSFLKSFFSSLVVAFLMGTVAFLPCKAKDYFKGVLLMYFFSGVFSGALMFVLFNMGGGVIKNGVVYAKAIYPYAIIFGVYKMIICAKGFLKRRMRESYSVVKISYKQKTVSTEGFFDTGNRLYDPITKKSVTLIDESVVKKLIKSECTAENLCEWIDDIRVIPYKTIGEVGILYGFFADYVVIDNKKYKNVLLAVSKEKITHPVILPCAEF